MSSSWLSRILLHLIMSELADTSGKSGQDRDVVEGGCLGTHERSPGTTFTIH